MSAQLPGPTAAAALEEKSKLRALRVGAARAQAAQERAGALKPPRIINRGGEDYSDAEEVKSGQESVGTMQCGVTLKADRHSDKYERCPEACPYWAQDRTDTEHCTFLCVKAEDCKVQNENKPIAEPKKGACRAPLVDHCEVYDLDGTDRCSVCQSAYRLGPDGQCYFKYMWAIYGLAGFFGLLFLFGTFWVLDMCCRPISNRAGLLHGLSFREMQKIHMPKQGDGHRQLFPITTNLCRENVAGAGMMLHFNFQVMIMLWALLVSAGWYIMAMTVDEDLLVLGRRKFGMPRENCILVAWGYHTQQRLMWTKILFCLIMYLASFALCLAHGVRQLRLFQEFDFRNKTMKDFVAIAVGLPPLPGTERVEESLERAVAAAGARDIVGVSCCWTFADEEEKVMAAVQRHNGDLEKRRMEARSNPPQPQPRKQPSQAPGSSRNATRAAGADQRGAPADGPRSATTADDTREAPEMNPVRSALFSMEVSLFGEDECQEDAEDPSGEDAATLEILKGLECSPRSFVVFETEAARDESVRRVASIGGFQIEGYADRVQLVTIDDEPDTVNWQNFGNSTMSQKIMRLTIGFGCIFLALLFWTTVFYAPYAWSIAHFNYSNGQQPGMIYGIAFSMVVVVGNAIMYEVCARVSDFVGFRFKDDREGCYMILYTIACTFNILLDMATTYYMALMIMTGLDFRTHDGRRIDEINSYAKTFETYAMQRSLAENLYDYAFPSTYLIPFLLEPIVTVWLPLRLGELIVRTHPEMVGRAAEGWLVSAPMEMGRYADILLDVLLAVLILYFPGGYTHILFLALAGSHLFIYAFDHWRVLNVIPACVFAGKNIDWWSQFMLAPCVGLVLSCLVFKANCQGHGYCLEGTAQIVGTCTLAWAAHFILHVLAITFIVPLFGRKEPPPDPNAASTYRAVNEKIACGWFSANPVHCLRSKLFYEHKPPCVFWESGKEHLLEPSEEARCYFKDEEEDSLEGNDGGAFGFLKKLSTTSFGRKEPANP